MKKFTLIFYCLSISFLTIVHGKNITWTGSVSNVWTNAANFSPSFVPDSLDTVSIYTTAKDPILQANSKVFKLVMVSGILDLNRYELKISDYGDFQGGEISKGNLVINGSTASFTGTLFNCIVNVSCGGIQLSGSTFNDSLNIENRAISTSSGLGGNTFNGPLKILNGGTGKHFYLAINNGDEYNSSVTLINQSNCNIYVAGSDTSYFNGNINFSNTGTGGIIFSRNGGVSFLLSGSFFSIGSQYSSGQLSLVKVFQQDADTHTIALTDSATLNISYSELKGGTYLSAPDVLIRNSIFDTDLEVIKTGGVNNQWYGSNEFHGGTFISNESSCSLKMAVNSGDNYFKDVKFSSPHALLSPCENYSTVFNGNIEITDSNIVFNQAIISGSNLQKLIGNNPFIFKSLNINNSADGVKTFSPIIIQSTMTFSHGKFFGDTDNFISFLHGSIVSGASDSSYVVGPVKKTGSASFTFPIGGSYFNPLSITATSSITNSYKVTLVDLPQIHGTLRDTSLSAIAYCNYWTLQKSGTGKVRIGVAFNHLHCGLIDSAAATVSVWDAQWKNFGKSLFSGNILGGIIYSLDSLTYDSTDICIAYKNIPITLLTVDLDATLSSTSHLVDHYFGLNGTNTLSGGEAWSNLNMQNSISRMRPSTMRYPGGKTGNFWDWRKGWFIDKNYPFQSCPGLPQEYATLPSLSPASDDLENFHTALGTIGSTPLFLLNMLSSNLPYQLAMLHEAEILGMPVTQVELGNEFYRSAEHECEYSEIFPLPTDYSSAADAWIASIRQRFSNSQVAIVGADSRDSQRQINWNDDLNITSFTNSPDAVTIHTYKGSNIPVNIPGSCEWIDYTTTAANANLLFSTAINYMDNFNDEETALNNKDLWLTEYNLFDRNDHYIHGSWAHALHTVAMTFSMLEKSYVKKINCHTMVGNAIFSSFFDNSTHGFMFPNSDFCPIGNPTTGSYSVTSLDYAMKELGEAARFATEVKKFDFSGTVIPQLDGTTPAVQGWLFKDADGNEQIIVLNLGNQAITIDFGSTPTGFHLPDKIKILDLYNNLFPGIERLNCFITNDNGTISYVYNNGSTGGTGSISDPIFSTYNAATAIPAYSIVHYSYRGTNAVTISASETSVCAGRDFYLYANAGPEAVTFEWYYNNTLLQPTNSPSLLTAEQGTDDYTVTVTYLNSSTVSSANAVSVSSKTIQTLTISATPTQFCAQSGIPVVLNSSLSGGGSPLYCWIPSDGESFSSGLASQLTDQVEVLPLHTTTYTVYATDGSCSVKQDIIINVIGDIQFEKNPLVYCTGSGPVTLDPQLPSPLLWNYEWSDSSTDPTLEVNPTDAETYTVTVNDNNGCSATASVDVIPVGCCSASGGAVSITDPVNAADFLTAVNAVCSCVTLNVITGPVDIYVDKEILLDDDVTLNNVTMNFAERGALIVDNYQTLRANGSTFTGCAAKMWKGIEVKKNGHLITDNYGIYDGEVSEAYEGILFNEMSYGLIRRTNFVNNYTGIRSLSNPSSLMFHFRKSLIRCNFECPGTLLDTYNNIPALPVSGVKGYAGIISSGDYINISSPSSNNPSHFGYLSNGIIASNSILSVSNTSFDHLLSESAYNWLAQGKGIMFTGYEKWSSIKITGLINDALPTFDNCEDAIDVYAASLTVLDSRFTNVNRGICSSFAMGHPLYIKGNTITANTRGIDLSVMDFTGRMIISNNQITVNNGSSNGVRGISLENLGNLSTPALSQFKCNDIILGIASNGIYVNSQNQTGSVFYLGLAQNNIVMNNNTSQPEGITFTNSTIYTLIENSVTGDGSLTEGTGYRFMMSPGGLMHNNYSTGTKRGFYFQSYSQSPESFRNNSMYKNWHGLELDPQSLMGTQTYMANNWPGYSLSTVPYEIIGSDATGAVNYNQSILGTLGSKFIVANHIVGSIRFPFYFPSSGDWFESTLSGTETTPSYIQCNVERTVEPLLSNIDSLSVIDSLYATAYENPLRQIAKINLYDKVNLFAKSNLLNTYYQNFIDTIQNHPTGQMLMIRDSLSSLLTFSSSSLAEALFNDSLLWLNLDYALSLSDVCDDCEIPDSLSALINSLIQNLDILTQLKNSTISNSCDWATENYTGISTSTDIESYLKESLFASSALLSRVYDKETLISNLGSVASLCPEEYGPGVFIARSILNAVGIKNTYNDEDICYPPLRIKQGINTNTETIIKYQTMPNPSKGEFKIINETSNFSFAIIKIYDMAGRKIPFNKIIVSEHEITIRCFAEPGTYLLHFKNDFEDYNEKIIILK